MKAFTKFALAALATMTLVGVSAQDRHGDPDNLDANTLAERRQEILDMSKGAIDSLKKDESAADLIGSANGAVGRARKPQPVAMVQRSSASLSTGLPCIT